MRATYTVILFLLLIPGFAAAGLQNRLAGHPSPYLDMHGQDPVHWQSWDTDVRDVALQQGRLQFISIGYFACHWCHVMQRESYQDEQIAALLNEFTVPVKVDRELHPGLDAQLIDFVRRTRGYAGWPLNVFLTPEGYSLVGFVYMPPDQFREFLMNLRQAWRDDPEEMTGIAARAAQKRGDRQQPPATEGGKVDFTARFERAIWQRADELDGGFGQPAKFPQVPQLTALLSLQACHPEERRREFLELTLDRMANLGLRDHIGGGFFRYTTDPGWRVPHFEKMLYDNALLVGVYVHAAEVLQQPRYLDVARDTAAFLYRDMQEEAGGYSASLSAIDDAGVEGGGYLWGTSELRAMLSEQEKAVATQLWSMDGVADFENGYLPVRLRTRESVKTATGLSGAGLDNMARELKRKLLRQRSTRSVPRDGKVIAGWNGLLLQSLVQLARATGEPQYRQQAKALRDDVVARFIDDDRVWRVVEGKGFHVPGTLEDYAYLAAGLQAWAGFAQSQADRNRVAMLVAQAWQRFYGKDGWRISETDRLAVQYREPAVPDGALPSPAAVLMAVTGSLGGEAKLAAVQPLLAAAMAEVRSPFAHAPFAHASYLHLVRVDASCL